MCRVFHALCALSILMSAAVGLSADPSRRPTRPGSFTVYSVYSVDDLVEQVTNNPIVAKRYSTHFGVSPEKLVAYFRANLKVVTLRAPMQVTTYFISRQGRIASKQRTLRPGRQVFVTVGNKPFIEIGCGNPLTKQMPAPEAQKPVQQPAKPEAEAEVKPIVETVGEPPIEEALALPPAEVVAEVPVQVAAAPAAVFGAPNLLKFLGMAAPLAAGLQYVQASKDTALVVIPEPSSFLAVGLPSLAAAVALARKRHHARK